MQKHHISETRWNTAQWSELLRCVARTPIDRLRGHQRDLPTLNLLREGGDLAAGRISKEFTPLWSYLLIVAILIGPSASLTAQSDPDKPSSRAAVGTVNVDFQYGKLTPGLWHLTGRVKLTTENYDLAGEDVKVVFAAGKSGASALAKATAEGNPATGQQVVANIRQPLQGQAYVITADHAVYTPDQSRPGGGAMNFTGHVKIVTKSGFLAEPSVSTTDHATILLGQNKDLYPQLETGPAHITLTPAQ